MLHTAAPRPVIALSGQVPSRQAEDAGLVVIEVQHAFNGATAVVDLSAEDLDGQRVSAVERRSGAIDVTLDGRGVCGPGRFELHLASESEHQTPLRYALLAGRRVLGEGYAWAPDSFTFRLPVRGA